MKKIVFTGGACSGKSSLIDKFEKEGHFVLREVASIVKPGISTKDLDDYAFKLIKEKGDEPAFLNYKPHGATFPFPASLCVSVNDEVVHCVPEKTKILKEGDIVSIDCGLRHRNLFTDSAITVPVGKIDSLSQELIDTTKHALEVGISSAVAGGHVGDIGNSIEKFTKNYKFTIVRELAGHGVGREIHEDPNIPNYKQARKGEKLLPGMVIAIEPILNIGNEKVIFEKDSYTVRTKDGKKSAHFEHTVLVTESGPEILTQI